MLYWKHHLKTQNNIRLHYKYYQGDIDIYIHVHVLQTLEAEMSSKNYAQTMQLWTPVTVMVTSRCLCSVSMHTFESSQVGTKEINPNRCSCLLGQPGICLSQNSLINHKREKGIPFYSSTR